MDTQYNLIILGPQGSGKGTQAQILKAELNLGYISTGVIFREAVAQGTELGVRVKDIIDHGNLVPDSVTNELVLERLSQPDCQQGFILDGYPRNLAQAEFLNDKHPITHVLEIWISDEEVVKRISGRRMCECGMTYHTEYNPPRVDGKCDSCGRDLFVRDDETEAALKQRLSIYHDQTEPLVEYYKQKGVHYRIHGAQTIPEVSADIKKILQYD